MVSLVSFVAYFLILTAAVTLVTALIRLDRPQHIVSEAGRFLVSITVGILLLCLIVAALEWVFV